jgi:Ca2+-binding RTX toxin-like protein
MVTFVANVAVDTQQLTELGLLSDFTHMKLVNRSSTTMTAKDQGAGVNFDIKGTAFLYSGKTPYAGFVQQIKVVESGDVHYKLSGLSIFVTNMDDYFSGSLSNLAQKIFQSNDTITGSNSADVLYGYDGKDTISGQKGADTINGGKGADHINGNSGNDTISGAKGGDNLKGSGGNDTISGNKGSDTINGGTGNDMLTGGSGSNTFVFNSALNASSNVDTITDMTPGTDTIDLSMSVFTKLSLGVLPSNAFYIGSAAHDGTDRIVYDDTTGAVYYTPKGDQGGSTEFAVLSTHLSLSHSDFLVIS